MKYGWITISITDMWNKPKYNSERVNQLLFSDMVKIREEKDNFYLVEKHDSYQGWVDKRFVASCPNKIYQLFIEDKKYMITAKSVSSLESKINCINPLVLYYGTSFPKVSKIKDGKAKITLPDNSSIIVPSSSLNQIPKRINASASQLIKEAKRFLGVPYLWGGVTSTGFDCSGLTQSILSRFGISVPRDTKDQITVGTEIPRENIKNGDLIFFKRHVGFAIGKDKIIHSSIGGGGIRINSLNSTEKEYRQDLDDTYNTTRRIL